MLVRFFYVPQIYDTGPTALLLLGSSGKHATTRPPRRLPVHVWEVNTLVIKHSSDDEAVL
jgi:hypothetical protein